MDGANIEIADQSETSILTQVTNLNQGDLGHGALTEIIIPAVEFSEQILTAGKLIDSSLSSVI